MLGKRFVEILIAHASLFFQQIKCARVDREIPVRNQFTYIESFYSLQIPGLLPKIAF